MDSLDGSVPNSCAYRPPSPIYEAKKISSLVFVSFERLEFVKEPHPGASPRELHFSNEETLGMCTGVGTIPFYRLCTRILA